MAAAGSCRIGFCGLGAMGGGIAKNLVRSGYSVAGYDIYQPLVSKLVDVGGSSALSPAAAARHADYLILMVVNAQQVDEVLFDPAQGAIEALDQNASIIVCSTCPPDYIRELGKRLENERPDIRLLDCPVSGGSIRAAEGTLSIFASGRNADIDNALVVLQAMAGSETLYRISGGLGMGSIAKMCHQHQAAVNIITASEIMGLAAMAGLNTKEVFEAIVSSPGSSFMFANRVPHMLSNDYLTVHSAVSIILKDVQIVSEHARTSGFPLPMVNLAQQMYIMGTYAGQTKEDDAGLVRLYLGSDNANAVGQLTKVSTSTGQHLLEIQDIIGILEGIHLASTLECLQFAQHVKMDLDLLFDIISKGAGSSKVFVSSAKEMILSPGGVGLGVVKGATEIRDLLAQGILKAGKLRQPLPMAAAALQQLYFQRC